MHRRILQAAAAMMMAVLMITGCTSQASNIGMAKDKENRAVDTGFTVSTVGSYDSADTAVVLVTDQQNQSVTFVNMDTGRQYTLYYDGTTYIKDKYGSPMAISQVKAGDVVDVNFLKGKRQIASMQLSPEAWVYENVENYDLGGINKTASIGSSTYSLPDDVVVLSGGQRTEVMDIVAQDTISVRGIDHEIYSINVERGHGYLRLRNDQALIGGWIEVGNSVIREITEDMLLVVPEGSYQVFLSNQGASCVKDVVVERDREIVLDVGDLEIPQDKTGKILLSVTPENAEVKIDGKTVDISKAIELSYGIHQVHLEAKGYDSLTKYIQVGSEYAKISFTLEEEREEDNTPSVSQNDIDEPEPEIEEKPVKEQEEIEPSVSENTITPSKANKVYIDAPKNVEVFLDGNYVGITPVSFKKVTGSHTVVLRKSGYQTKSYTIYLYDDGEDITYSFTDLEKEVATVSENNVDSSSKTSSNSGTSSGSSTQNPSSGTTQTPSSGSTQTPGGDGNTGDGNGGDTSGDGEGNTGDGNGGDTPGDGEGNTGDGNGGDTPGDGEGNTGDGNGGDTSGDGEGNTGDGNGGDTPGDSEGNTGGGNGGDTPGDGEGNTGGGSGGDNTGTDNNGDNGVNGEDKNTETIANSGKMFVESINHTYTDIISNSSTGYKK